MCRRLAFAATCVLAIGCGRYAFERTADPDARANGDAGGDGADAAVPLACPDTSPRMYLQDAGEEMGCAVLADHSLWCWGNNLQGQLGQNDNAYYDVPVRVGTSVDWELVSAGRVHACGVRLDGTAWCWGSNTAGQLGTGDTTQRLVPTRVGVDSDWARVAVGRSFSCALRTNNTLWCWGTIGGPTPTQMGTAADWTAIAGGISHACGIRAGEVWCMGTNGGGQLGTGNTTSSSVPVRAMGTTGFVTVTAAAGGSYTCGVQAAGALWCWGINDDGQLGLGDIMQRLVPTRVGTDADWVAVSAGAWHACGIRTGGRLACWGNDGTGQAGGASTVPHDVVLAAPARAVSLGEYHTSVRDTNDFLWGFGGNQYAQLGLPGSGNVTTPTPVCL